MKITRRRFGKRSREILIAMGAITSHGNGFDHIGGTPVDVHFGIGNDEQDHLVTFESVKEAQNVRDVCDAFIKAQRGYKTPKLTADTIVKLIEGHGGLSIADVDKIEAAAKTHLP